MAFLGTSGFVKALIATGATGALIALAEANPQMVHEAIHPSFWEAVIAGLSTVSTLGLAYLRHYMPAEKKVESQHAELSGKLESVLRELGGITFRLTRLESKTHNTGETKRPS